MNSLCIPPLILCADLSTDVSTSSLELQIFSIHSFFFPRVHIWQFLRRAKMPDENSYVVIADGYD